MAHSDDDEPDESDLPQGPQDGLEDGIEGEELERGLVLDPEDLGDFDDEAGDDDDEDSAEEGEDEANPQAHADGPAEKPKSKAKKKAEEEEPGPDLPLPSLKVLRAAMGWAFEKEVIEGTLLDRFAEHARLMLKVNPTVQVTTVLEPKEIAAKHYLDSWRLTQMMSLMGKTVLDLGSGPGFPGLPLAMSEPHCKMILVDCRKQTSAFSAMCIKKLKIKNAVSHWGRGEEFLTTQRVDVVLVRDLSSVRENVRTLRKVRHSLKHLMMLKGSSWSREVHAGQRETERLGFTLDTVWEHELPDEMGKRAILIYRAPGAM